MAELVLLKYAVSTLVSWLFNQFKAGRHHNLFVQLVPHFVRLC